MKRKKLLCALAAFVLLLSAQPPAAALLSNQRGTEIAGTTRMPVISVTIPGSATILFNPYELPVDIDGEASREQIVCSPAIMYSRSDIPLKVSVTVTGHVRQGSDMTLAAAPIGGTDTAKSVFIYFEIVQSDWDEVRRSLWAEAYDPAKHIVLDDGYAHTKTDVLTLSPMTKDGDVAKGGYAQFRLAGNAVRTPTSEWTTKDGIDVTVAFTFTPVPYT